MATTGNQTTIQEKGETYGHQMTAPGWCEGGRMSHPIDRRQRFLIGKKLGKKRAFGYWKGYKSENVELERTEWARIASYKRRDTTKLCSCEMCGNPRYKAWKRKDQLTIQEKRFYAQEFEGEI